MKMPMKFENTFLVDLSLPQVWALLTDLPRVAPCLPGARLDEVIDGDYRGGLCTQIGPITANYRGSMRFLELDEVTHRAVIAARGREEHGRGSATATITAALAPADGGTAVTITTDLAISGHAAQFDHGLLAEVSTSLIAEFVRRLEAGIDAGGGTAASPGAATAAQLPSPRSPAVSSVPAVPSIAAVAGLGAVLAGFGLGFVLGRRRGA
jgi:carbon monoxide dehydrogenase subunit G